MTKSENSFRRSSLTLKLLVFALFAVCGISRSTQAQEFMKGTFVLSAETHFGTTLLPAGHYTVSVEPVTSMTASGTRVLVFIRPESKSGPVASTFAMASQESCDTPSGLKLVSDGAGLAARSLCIAKQGLMIDFDLSRSEKAKTLTASAQQ
jgi:hypothetical protein